MVRELLQASQVDGEKIAEVEQKMELLSLDNQQKMELLTLESQELRGMVDGLGQTVELGLEGIKNAVAQVSHKLHRAVLWVKCFYGPWYTMSLALSPQRKYTVHCIEHRAGKAVCLASWRKMTQTGQVLSVMVALECFPCVRIFPGMKHWTA
jgi:hypothetical protein